MATIVADISKIAAALLALTAVIFYTEVGRRILIKAVIVGFFSDNDSLEKLVDLIIKDLRTPKRKTDIQGILTLQELLALSQETMKVFSQTVKFVGDIKSSEKDR